MINLSEPPLKTSQTERLDISRIRTDSCTQARANLHKGTITEYVEAMTAGEIFPPVTVFYDGKDYWLADGFHRLEAARRILASEISVNVRQGTKREAILYAVGANTKHGLRRSNADKRRAVEILLNDLEWSQWSNRELAKRCGVSLDLVNRLRREMNPAERFVQSKNFTNDLSSESSGLTPQLKRKGADGRIINVANIGKTLTAPSDDIPLINSKEDNPALDPAKGVKKKALATTTDQLREEHLPGKESKAMAEFEVGSFVQVIDKSSPQFLEISKIVSVEYPGVNILTSQGEKFFLKKDLSSFVPLEKFETDWLPKESSVQPKESSVQMFKLQPKESSYIRVLSIEKEDSQPIQDAVQILEITSTGLRVKIECAPLMLIYLFQQMQDFPAFAEEVMQRANLFAEGTEMKYGNPK